MNVFEYNKIYLLVVFQQQIKLQEIALRCSHETGSHEIYTIFIQRTMSRAKVEYAGQECNCLYFSCTQSIVLPGNSKFKCC